MTDWVDHIARGRRRAEALLWLIAAAVIALVMAAGTALALRLPPAQGRETGAKQVMNIDLTALPPAPYVAEVPEAAPPAPPPEPDPEPEKLVEAEPDPKPAPVVKPAPDPEPQPEPELKPDPKPQAKPDPKPAQKPVPKPRKKAQPSPEKPRKTDAAPPPQKASGGAAASAKGSANPNAVAKWQRKVAGQMGAHMRRLQTTRELKLELAIAVAGDGRITGVSVVRSSGDAKFDAKAVALARRKGKIAPPPSGNPVTLNIPING